MVALTAVLMIIGFIVLDLAIQYFFKPQTVQAFSAVAARITIKADELLSDFFMPLGYFFHPGHTWARIEDRGDILIGADDFVQMTLGRIDKISLPAVGQKINSNSPAFRLMQGNKQATFLAPISGTVIEVNSNLMDSPNLLKDQPYDSGWVMKIKPSSAAEDIKALLIADPAVQWLKKEISTFKDFLMEIAGQKSELGLTLADGGVPVSGVMQEFGETEWKNFQDRFLNGNAA